MVFLLSILLSFFLFVCCFFTIFYVYYLCLPSEYGRALVFTIIRCRLTVSLLLGLSQIWNVQRIQCFKNNPFLVDDILCLLLRLLVASPYYHIFRKIFIDLKFSMISNYLSFCHEMSYTEYSMDNATCISLPTL